MICHQKYSTSGIRPRGLFTRNLLQDLEQCFANEYAQADISRFLIYNQVTAGILGAISTPMLGSLSDRIGRKPILACAAIGPLLYEVIMILILRYPDSIDMHWLLLGYALEGLSGTMITASSTSQAYITDLVGPRERTRLFGYLQAAMQFAAAAGPIISGLLLTLPNSLELIYWIAGGAHLSLTLIFLFVLPESRSSADRDEAASEQPSEGPFRILLTSLKSVWRSQAFRQKNVIILATMDLFAFGIMMGIPSLQLAYVAFLFKWQATTQSIFTSAVYSWSILVLVLLFPLAMDRVRRWKQRGRIPNLSSVFNAGDVGAIQVNLLLQSTGYLGMALAKAPAYFIISSLIVTSGASINPLLISCLTAHVPTYQSGQLLGVLSFLHAIARVIIPAMLNAAYSMTIGLSPAPLFVLLSSIMGSLLFASMYIKTNIQ